MLYDIDGNIISVAYDVDGNAFGTAYDIDGNVVGSVKGPSNAVLSSDLLTDTKWTPLLNTILNPSGNPYPALTQQTGINYSSAHVEDGYVQLSISLYTFMCALKNEKSVLYTESAKGYNSTAYYGTICTSLVATAWGLPCIVTTVCYPKADFLTEVELSDVKVGDALCGDGHAVLVIDVEYDENDAPTKVRTSESVQPTCRKNSFVSYANFSNTTKKLYRYKNINNCDSFYASRFPKWDGKTPDIMTNFGDKVTRKYGTDIDINIIDSTNYGSIQIYKDGTLIETKATIEDFTLTSPAVGKYEVRMINSINPKRTSSTFFDIVDCTAVISGNSISVNTSGCVLTAIGGYPAFTQNSNGKSTSWDNNKRVHLATVSEIQSGVLSITEMLNDPDCNGGIWVYVSGEYGNVSFRVPYAL